MLNMHWSFMIGYTCKVGAYGQVCIGLIEVFLHKVIVCILGHHELLVCYYVDMLVEIEWERKIIKVKLQH